MKREYYVYILTNTHHTVLYTGVTGSIAERIWQHKQGLNEGFTKKYNAHKLIYVESFDDVWQALEREKQLKKWTRKKKVGLINRLNPDWRDIYSEICR